MKYVGIELDACYPSQIIICYMITQFGMFMDAEVCNAPIIEAIYA